MVFTVGAGLSHPGRYFSGHVVMLAQHLLLILIYLIQPKEFIMVAENNPFHILIVDDDPVIRRLTRRMLNSLGYEVIEAENGVDALNRFNENTDIDLVLSDLKMPKMNGLELAEEIRQLQRTSKFILISGANNSFRQIDEDMYYMQKPYTRESLGQVITMALS